MTQRNDQLSALLQEHINAGEFPSAVYLVADHDRIVFTDALGYSVVEPYRVANKLDTIYDLASLTKPLITAMLCARRIELGELTLDSSVSHYLPEFDRTDKQMITVREPQLAADHDNRDSSKQHGLTSLHRLLEDRPPHL